VKTVYWDKHIPRVVASYLLRRIWPGVTWSPLSPVSVKEMPDPPLPGPRWLRVRNRQCGICASDLSILYTKPSVDIALAAVPALDRIYLGHELVGEVVELGHEVTRYQVGDRVAMEARYTGSPNCHTQEIDPPCRQCAAGQTRLCENKALGKGPNGVGAGWGDTCIAHESEVWPIPTDLNDDQASLVEPSAVALHAVLRRPPQAGEQVLIIGAGIIGLLVLQAARVVAPEAQITIMARYPHQADMARALGVDRVIAEDGSAYARVAEITGARHYRFPLNRGMLLGGFEVIYDCVGKANTIVDGLRWARAGGTYVMVGIAFESLKVDLSPVWYQEVDLIGSHTFGMENWRGRRVHTFDLVIEMMQEGALRHEGLITHRFPLAELRRAVAVAGDRRQGAIKVMLDCRADG
jgi:threonine dehydrogenase-like Zn-dependent dehydrogenase